MLVLITGMPGDGKTLRMISDLKEISERDGRPVFYHGIKGLKLPWHHLTEDEILHWYEHLPPNAILALDEGQQFFRPTMANREPPKHITELETHRHLGVDIWVTTQDPTFVHAHWRKLAKRHLHLQRKFGFQAATLYEWTSVQEKPLSSLHRATESLWPYPKDVYDLYESAEVHTHKVKLPKKIIFACLLPFLILGGLWYGFYSWYEQSFKGATGVKEKKPDVVVDANRSPSSSSQNTPKSAPVQMPPPDPKAAYLASHTPVLTGMPHTAPVYAAITAPKRAPAPVACVQSKQKCQCYTDDGTRLPQVPDVTCQQIVDHGFYVDWVIPPIVQARAAPPQRDPRAAPAEQ